MFSQEAEENTDICHFNIASEKDYGVQCVILREAHSIKEYTAQHSNIFSVLFEGRTQNTKDVAFLHVASPGKAFGHFDKEKYKIALLPKAYFNVLEFFKTEWPLVFQHMETDYQAAKVKKEWIWYSPTINIRNPGHITFQKIIDSAGPLKLTLQITKNVKIGKTNISLFYSDETMGSIQLPPLTMVNMANDLASLNSLYHYKDEVPSKKSRQS